MGSSKDKGKWALYLVIVLVSLALGIAAGFALGFVLKDCDGDDDPVADARAPRVFNHAPGPCQLVDGLEHGSEDMQLLPSGLAIISSGVQAIRPVTPETWQMGIGKLKTFDFTKPVEGATDLTILPTEALDLDNFNPHGLSVYQVDTGEVYVFVINHHYTPDMRESVEKFQLDEDARTLTHLRTIEDDEHFTFVNDLVATGPDSFYYTNYLSTRKQSEQLPELMSGDPKASVGYYDGQVGRIVLENQHASNGINISPDGRYVYIANFGSASVLIYERSANNDLEVLVEDYYLGTFVDNIVVQGDYVWVGGAPQAGATLEEALLNQQPPSQIQRLTVENGKVTEAVEVFSDDGSVFKLPRCSVGMPQKNGLLIGNPTKRALYCEVGYVGLSDIWSPSVQAPRVFNHAPGPCQLVDGLEHGSEDMQLLPSGLAIVSSGVQAIRPVTPETWQKGIGKLKTFDFTKPEEGATDLTILPTDDLDLDNFNPHGLSVYQVVDTGDVYVFVINHHYTPDMRESVEKFQLDEDARTLTHLRTIEDDEHFTFVNDLVATGPDSFYYTNYLSTRKQSEQLPELMSGEAKASVGYYDGQEGRIVLENQHVSNGINISPDRRYVYIANFGSASVLIYERSANNDLEVLVEDYYLGTFVDNIVVQGDYLWVGGAPQAGATLEEALLNQQPPSQIQRLKVETGKVTEAVEVFSDDGSVFKLPRCSVGLPRENGLLIGNPTKTALYCEVGYVGPSDIWTQSPSAGSHRVFIHAPGPCQLVDGLEHGSEDMQLLPSGLAIVSSGVQAIRPVTPDTWQIGIGKLKTFDFTKPEEGATDLTILPTDDLDLDNFNPHGLSVYQIEDTGDVYVFVINHHYTPDMRESVEKFQLDEDARTLTHLRTIEDDEHFTFVNDLVATGPDSFYYTNYLSTRKQSEQLPELMSGEAKASVGYYDGQVGRIVLENQHVSNGINMSPDGGYVYIANFGSASVLIYERSANNDLEVMVEDYYLGAFVDNIVVQGDYLWVGGAPQAGATIGEALLNQQPPSQIQRLTVENGKVTEAVEVFSDDGSVFKLPRCSVGLPQKNGLLIGNPTKTALYCEVGYVG